MHRLLVATAAAQSLLVLALLLFEPQLENHARSRPGGNLLFLVPVVAQCVVFAAAVLLAIFQLRARSLRPPAVAALAIIFLVGYLVAEAALGGFWRYSAV